MNFLRNARDLRERAWPTLKESAFLERGVLTPEEFVAAGDQLVYRCPTWQWETGDPSHLRPYLPRDKQYLVTRGVPCKSRVAALGTNTYTEAVVSEDGEDGDWLATNFSSASSSSSSSSSSSTSSRAEDVIEEIGGDDDEASDSLAEKVGDLQIGPAAQSNDENVAGSGGGGSSGGAAQSDDLLDDLVDDDVVAGDEFTLMDGEGDSKILRTRTYDLSITYDKYYQTPRMWLFGYDEDNQPLDQEAIFQDVMQDYAQKTVTVDPHPHLGTLHASVHPCKHAITMKRIVDSLRGLGRSDGNGGAGAAATAETRPPPSTNQYMFIFLKFIGSVVPTIEYDFTMEVAARGRDAASEATA